METSKKSTGDESNPLTSFAEAIHASLSAQQANDEAKTTQDTYGRGSEKPLASYDPDTQSWKMYGDTCLWGEPQSLQKLPPSGMTRNGVLYQQPVWVPITDVIESSSWPTPTSRDHKDGQKPRIRNGKVQTDTLGRAVQMWPTPTAVTRPMEGNVRLYRAKVEAGEMTEEEAAAILGKSVWEAQGKIPAMWPTPTTQEVEHPDAVINDKGRRVSKDGKNSHSLGLADAVQRWPTPTAADGYTHAMKSSQQTLGSRHSLNLPSAAGGQLNPTWVEWLMGFPAGWTDLEA
jgi:hypothetical protein